MRHNVLFVRFVFMHQLSTDVQAECPDIVYIYIYIYVYVYIYIYIIIIMIVLIVILVIIVIVVIIIMIMIMMIMESPRIALRDSGRPARREPRPAWPHSSRHHSSNYLFNLCIDGVIINECKH